MYVKTTFKLTVNYIFIAYYRLYLFAFIISQKKNNKKIPLEKNQYRILKKIRGKNSKLYLKKNINKNLVHLNNFIFR